MPAYTSFAVVGVGVTVGLPIVKELLARKVSVLVLTRPSSSSKILPSGAKLAAVDYADTHAVADVLREHKVEVVISTIAPGLPAQVTLADGAKEAGVKLFAPSEYGMPTVGHTESILGIKSQFGEHLKAIGLPSALFYVGFFFEQLRWLTGIDETQNFYIAGKGNTPASITAISDIAGFVAHVLTTLPPSQLADAVFRLQGIKTTLLEIASLYPPDTPVIHVDALPSNVLDHEFRTALQKDLEQGYASTGWDPLGHKDVVQDAGSSNKLWEGHQWKGVKDLKKVLGI